jgi:hypothetical protein
MTEADWHSSADPQQMLQLLRDRGRLTQRKARLFACACCRSIWDGLPLPWGQEAVEVGERFADGLTTNRVRHGIREALQREKEVAITEQDFYRAASLRDAHTPVDEDIAQGRFYLGPWDQPGVKCGILRDLVGPLPFSPVAIPPSVRMWRDGTVVRLAQAAYNERSLPGGTLDNVRLAVLADALEEAGCQLPEILTHLRAQSIHWRGCWALDLLLDKE